jgi:hypothetical protein
MGPGTVATPENVGLPKLRRQKRGFFLKCLHCKVQMPGRGGMANRNPVGRRAHSPRRARASPRAKCGRQSGRPAQARRWPVNPVGPADRIAIRHSVMFPGCKSAITCFSTDRQLRKLDDPWKDMIRAHRSDPMRASSPTTERRTRSRSLRGPILARIVMHS